MVIRPTKRFRFEHKLYALLSLEEGRRINRVFDNFHVNNANNNYVETS